MAVLSAVADAWQQALAAEYAAVFGYGLLGPHLSAAAQVTLARTSQTQHEQLATATATALVAAGQSAPPPQADYSWMYPVTDYLSAQRLAIRLETNCASVWRYLIATAAAPNTSDATLAAVRASAMTALSGAAVRAMQWRATVNPSAPTVAFPGI
jgi:Domain of unknown function (DUF4439)